MGRLAPRHPILGSFLDVDVDMTLELVIDESLPDGVLRRDELVF